MTQSGKTTQECLYELGEAAKVLKQEVLKAIKIDTKRFLAYIKKRPYISFLFGVVLGIICKFTM